MKSDDIIHGRAGPYRSYGLRLFKCDRLQTVSQGQYLFCLVRLVFLPNIRFAQMPVVSKVRLALVSKTVSRHNQFVNIAWLDRRIEFAPWQFGSHVAEYERGCDWKLL